MLSQKHRLKKKKDIEIVFKKGKVFRENLLLLRTVKNELNFYRFGFIVSQKVSKKANIRNKIKRRMREVLRLKVGLIKSGTDNLLIALPGLEKKDFKEFKEIIDKLFKKAKFYN